MEKDFMPTLIINIAIPYAKINDYELIQKKIRAGEFQQRDLAAGYPPTVSYRQLTPETITTATFSCEYNLIDSHSVQFISFSNERYRKLGDFSEPKPRFSFKNSIEEIKESNTTHTPQPYRSESELEQTPKRNKFI